MTIGFSTLLTFLTLMGGIKQEISQVFVPVSALNTTRYELPAASLKLSEISFDELEQREEYENPQEFLNRTVPGYAGVILDVESGHYNLYLKEGSAYSLGDHKGLERAVAYAADVYHLNAENSWETPNTEVTFDMFYVKYSFKELQEMIDAILELPIAKECMIFISPNDNRIIIGRLEGVDKGLIESEILRSGLPNDAFEVRGVVSF